MVIGGEFADWAKIIGHDHQDEQRGQQGNGPIHQAKAEHNGNCCEGNGGKCVKHSTRKRCSTQCLHCCYAEFFACLIYAVSLFVATAEVLQGIDAAQRIDEMVCEALVFAMLLAGFLLCSASDENHLKDDGGKHQKCNKSRNPVLEDDNGKKNKGHRDQRHRTRQSGAQIVLDVVDTIKAKC